MLNKLPQIPKQDRSLVFGFVDGNENYVINGMKRLLKSKDLFSILIEIQSKNTNHTKILEEIKNNGFKEDLKSGNDTQKNFIFRR